MRQFLEAPGCQIPVSEISWTFTTSSGPGGQHANKSNTGVDARVNLETARGISSSARERLLASIGAEMRVYVDGERSQARNRAEAMDRLSVQLAEALVVSKVRKPTKRSRGSQKRRMKRKRQRSEVKKNRQRPKFDE